MQDAVVKQIVSADKQFRLSICQRDDGLFFYRHDWFANWDDAPPAWQDGHPPSGIFASVAEAEAEARSTIAWLRND